MKFSNLIFSLSIIFLIVAVSTVQSQCPPVYTFTGEAANDRFGISVSGAGDVNNDGFVDFIVGAERNDAGGTSAGRAYVYSGQDGTLLYIFTGEAAEDRFGRSVSGTGDVNNDGFDDLIVRAFLHDVGWKDVGQAYVYSGQSGAMLYTFSGEALEDWFGQSVSGAGDVNNDGFNDLIVGAPRNNAGGSTAGRAYVYSGQDGVLLYTFTGNEMAERLGESVSSAGDVNNDGFDDLIVGARLNDAGGKNAGRAYVFSGQTGDKIYTFTGEAVGDWFGISVSGAGDVNNDGFDDLIVGAIFNDAGGFDAGRAYIYSGQSGALLYTFTGEAAQDGFGVGVSGAGDVNNDGFDDLIVGAFHNSTGGASAGRAYVYSGKSGALLYTFTGEGPQDWFGNSVSGAGDVNNDGSDDLIVGSYNAGAYVFTCATWLCGDANGDSLVNVDDVDFLMNFYFYAGATPFPYLASDLNCDGSVNIADITYLAAYINGTGAPPCCQQ